MKITQLTKIATDKSKFKKLPDFLNFAVMYLEYVATKLQAVIVSRNENRYQFYQYGSDGGFQITRPINSRLMYNITLGKWSREIYQLSTRQYLEKDAEKYSSLQVLPPGAYEYVLFSNVRCSSMTELGETDLNALIKNLDFGRLEQT